MFLLASSSILANRLSSCISNLICPPYPTPSSLATIVAIGITLPFLPALYAK